MLVRPQSLFEVCVTTLFSAGARDPTLMWSLRPERSSGASWRDTVAVCCLYGSRCASGPRLQSLARIRLCCSDKTLQQWYKSRLLHVVAPTKCQASLSRGRSGCMAVMGYCLSVISPSASFLVYRPKHVRMDRCWNERPVRNVTEMR